MTNHPPSTRTDPAISICMLVVDANDVRELSHSQQTLKSPVLHPAVHNLLEGLKSRHELKIEVIYGRQNPEPGELRTDGSITYVPVTYSRIPFLKIGGAYLGRTIALLKHIRRTKPDIVHAQGTERESAMVAVLSGRTRVLTIHGNFREIAKTLKAERFSYLWFNSRIENELLPRMHGVICISNYTRELVESINPHTWVLPNAVNDEMFSVVNTPVQGRVVCIAAVDQRKNQVAFIEAADSLAAKFPHFQIHFWGSTISGSDYDKQFHDALGNRPWAIYKGVATPAEIAAILAEADVLVLPTVEDNCPVVILEAMAAGVPVVASQVGGIPDLIQDGETGFMFPSDNQAGLANAVARILESPDLRKRLAAAAKVHAQTHFKPDTIATAHLKIYQSMFTDES